MRRHTRSSTGCGPATSSPGCPTRARSTRRSPTSSRCCRCSRSTTWSAGCSARRTARAGSTPPRSPPRRCARGCCSDWPTSSAGRSAVNGGRRCAGPPNSTRTATGGPTQPSKRCTAAARSWSPRSCPRCSRSGSSGCGRWSTAAGWTATGPRRRARRPLATYWACSAAASTTAHRSSSSSPTCSTGCWSRTPNWCRTTTAATGRPSSRRSPRTASPGRPPASRIWRASPAGWPIRTST